MMCKIKLICGVLNALKYQMDQGEWSGQKFWRVWGDNKKV